MKPTLRTDSRKIFKTFNVGDYVMVWIYSNGFLRKLLKYCMPIVLDFLRSWINWIAIPIL